MPETRPLIAMDGEGRLEWRPAINPVPEDFIDFGLPSGTLWYNKNIGATCGNTPESWYGNYYAWGELDTKDNYTWSTYKFGNRGDFTKYNLTDGLTQLLPEDDIATYTNEMWAMPTAAQVAELVEHTEVE